MALLPIIIGGLCGYFGGQHAVWNGVAFGDLVARIAILLLIVYVAVYIHIIVHEAGHLVAGLMSGYSFVSFRIGKYMILKKEDRYILKKQRICRRFSIMS